MYVAVVERASDAGYPACEAMIRGVCVGVGQHWHHRQLRSQGGEHKPENGLFICHLCHDHIHKHPKESYENGWLVRSHEQPENIPVSRRGCRVLLIGETFEGV